VSSNPLLTASLPAALTAAAVLGLSACIPSKAEIQRSSPQSGQAVEVMPVRTGSMTVVGNYHGSVEPLRTVIVSAQVGGQVVTVSADEGAVVEKGQLLAALEDDPFRIAEGQAQEALAGAQVRVEQMQKGIDVERKTFETGRAQAQAALDMAQARLRMVENGARAQEKKQLEAGVEAARAALDNSRLESERVVSLFSSGAATQQMVDAAKAGWDSSKARHEQAVQAYRLIVEGARPEDKESARAAVRQAEAGLEAADVRFESLILKEKELEAAQIQVKAARLALEAAGLNRSRARIVSPVEGRSVVSARTVEAGEIAAPGKPLFELVDISRVKVVVRVPGRDVNYFKVTQTLSMSCIGDLPAGRTRTGTVTWISVKAHQQNTTFPVEVEVENAAGELRAGQVCEVIAPLETVRAIIVPRDAVLDAEEGKVALVEQEGVVRERPVVLRAEQDGLAAVSSGLAEGDRLVVVGERMIKDGDAVRVLKEHPAVVPGAPVGK
jgi:RND family efflux transporter MFP subunit